MLLLTASPGIPLRRDFARPKRRWVAVLSLSLVGLIALTVLFLRTPDGAIRIEIKDPDIRVTVGRKRHTVRESGRSFTMNRELTQFLFEGVTQIFETTNLKIANGDDLRIECGVPRRTTDCP